MKLFAVKDLKAALYQAFFVRNKAEAIRNFTMLANNPDSMIARFPADYRLIELGELEESTGQYFPLDPQLDLGGAVDFKSEQAPQPDLGLKSV
ncbi:MAG: hypothetical protein QXT77_08785 [Candidatus Methanomethylicaceae archaeon]